MTAVTPIMLEVTGNGRKANVVLMLDQRRRRRADIKTTLGHCLVLVVSLVG